MTISEKINRIQAIPKKIVEIERNRDRLKSPNAFRCENTGASAGTPDNTSEIRMVNYSSAGAEIEKLTAERDDLVKEIQAEIDEILSGEDAYAIDRREVIKSKFINGDTLKYISCKVIHRNYTTTKKMFQEGCEELKIALNCH
ncbi:MAG: hypothetical protein Q4E74_12165 [Ruminococcus sp.]|nr:hypothetical protein [Ruminococcus sp.]